MWERNLDFISQSLGIGLQDSSVLGQQGYVGHESIANLTTGKLMNGWLMKNNMEIEYFVPKENHDVIDTQVSRVIMVTPEGDSVFNKWFEDKMDDEDVGS